MGLGTARTEAFVPRYTRLARDRPGSLERVMSGGWVGDSIDAVGTRDGPPGLDERWRPVVGPVVWTSLPTTREVRVTHEEDL